MSTNQPVILTMFVILALLMLSHGVGNIRGSTVPENSTDMLALLDFKQAITNDPRGVLSNNWSTSTPYCQWDGVTCSLRHPGRVTTLDLAGKGLSGSIAASVGNLTFLRTLDLSNNHLSGQIPHLNNLQKMQLLNLSSNSLGGIIPDTLTNCSSLRELHLANNLLEGEIPLNVDLLSNLSVLVLFNNIFTGIIPPTLTNITNLTAIALRDNQLHGSIPDDIGQLKNLYFLGLGNNGLSGKIPDALFNLSSLVVLELQTNMFDIKLPPNIGDRLPNLQQLLLHANTFEGYIPASLGNASRLKVIDLSSNSFSGQIPSSFGMLLDLNILNLEENNLEATDRKSWEFLYTLTNCSSLQVLSLYNNRLQGVIPDSIGNLSTGLHFLLLDQNMLSGVVPPSIGNFRGLYSLELGNNNFSGTIEWIGNLRNLQALTFQGNNFIGSIPSSIGNLTLLTKIDLGNNKFEGSIPPSLGNLSQLLSLDLSNNNFEGSIPQEFSKLNQLTELNLSSNKLTREIPSTLSQCQNLLTLQMAQNFLVGNIPVSFGNLKSLSMLNLSHNNLSGTIPTALSDLVSLTYLDISYNNLQGEIPIKGVFKNATGVSLHGNSGLCGGATDLHMPSCPTVLQRTERQNHLVKILIPIFGFMSFILLVYLVLLAKKTSRKTYLSSPSLSEHFLKVSYNDLAQATSNFSESNLIGRGSYGTVYKGKLKDTKMEVAVKVFDLDMRGAEKSFMSECEALRSIQHRNLLPIITACSTVDNTGNVFKALVYEFMTNGNLDTWIHHKVTGKTPKRLSLTQRISIAVNIADALDYLHYDCGRPTVHCDLKPSNILLDDDMTGLLGDFGIARFYVNSWSTSAGSTSSIGVKGTIGYIAPEYGGGGHVSTAGDVYSFGVVLLEMMTGKRPTDPIFTDGLDIVNFVGSNVPHQIFHVIDANLVEECKDFVHAEAISESGVYQCLVSLLQVALSCTCPLPSERMNMKQIASKMHAIKMSYLGWESKKYASRE